MSDMKHSFLVLCAAALAATACTNDELGNGTLPQGARPLVINASGLQSIATPQTRGTLEGNWDGVKTVGVRVQLSTSFPSKEYKVEAKAGSSNAHLSPAEPLGAGDVAFWWTSTTETKTVTAWCPYGDGNIPSVWTIPVEQTAGNMQAADLLLARKEGMTLQESETGTFEFRHMLSKVRINLKASDYLQSAAKVDVQLLDQYTSADFDDAAQTLVGNGGRGNAITPCPLETPEQGCYASYEALVIPFTADDKDKTDELIGITVDDDAEYVYRLPKDYNGNLFQQGLVYTFNITVDAKGLDVQVSESIDWNATNPGSGGITLKDTYDQATNTYYVYTAEGLDAWATKARTDLTVSCILMDDIDYNDKEWTTIGTGNTSIESYSGTFDGGGHTIRNIKIKDNAQNNGLFGYIAGGGTVKNLTVKNASMTTSSTKYGIIAAWNDGTIENCVVSSCDITGSSGYVGCFSSENRGRISRCRVDDVNVLGDTFGGIVWNNQGRIEASSFQGHINADGGALAEWNLGGTIIACWTNATHQEGKTVAGIVRTLLDGSVTACYYGGDMDAGILEDNTGNGDATKVGGSSFWTWKEASDLMNNELGPDFGWHLQTDNWYTPPTLVPNN